MVFPILRTNFLRDNFNKGKSKLKVINFVHKIPSIACHTPSSLVYVISLHSFIIFIAFIIDKKDNSITTLVNVKPSVSLKQLLVYSWLLYF